MKIKDGVNIQGIRIELRPVLVNAEEIWKGLGTELVVTGGLDGTHSAGSLHYYGLALDLRSRDFSASNKTRAAELLKVALGRNYDVITHKSHIHVEYDPK